MRLPLPKNTLVQFTIIGAVLTAAVAVALGAPVLGLAEDPNATESADAARDDGQVTAMDAPTPNDAFTPEVQDRGGEYEEHEEYEDEHEEEEEYEEDEEYEDEEHEEEEEYEEDEDH